MKSFYKDLLLVVDNLIKESEESSQLARKMFDTWKRLTEPEKIHISPKTIKRGRTPLFEDQVKKLLQST